MEANQATLNIGMIGHVAHGKSTIVKAVSTVKTQRFKDEHIRNITIKLGYANAKIYQSEDGNHFDCHSSAHPIHYYDEHLEQHMHMKRHISFVDCPGHDSLMTTMLTGTSVMDAAILLISAKDKCPQPQTVDHLIAAEMMDLKHNIIIQNKIDLVTKEKAKEQFTSIKEFIRGTIVDGAPIIPMSAQLSVNIQALCEEICKIPTPVRDMSCCPRMVIVRTFNTNKPGCSIEEYHGGVVGGSIIQGILRVGQEIVILPGLVQRINNETTYRPLYSTIISLKTEKNVLTEAGPGGLIGVGLQIDPCLTKSDHLVGHCLGIEGQLPKVTFKIQITYRLLRHYNNSTDNRIPPLRENETLMVNICSTQSAGKITCLEKMTLVLLLTKPICVETNERVALSRRLNGKWCVIGYGNHVSSF